MKALHAIYQHGKIFFPFHFPESDGPVKVMVIFPEETEPFADDQFFDEDDHLLGEEWMPARKGMTVPP